MSKIKFLVIALCISFAGMFASCYYDYGIDPNDSDIVGTIYNTDYNFGAITKYNLVDTVIKGSGVTAQYDTQILANLRSNLNALGWTSTTDTAGPGVILVTCGITSGTVVVNSGYDWWGYYGYSWYYPPYYSYSYSYTTGTLVMLMADANLADGSNAPVQWSGILNGATGQTTSTSTLISNGINQAFAQSPYLR